MAAVTLLACLCDTEQQPDEVKQRTHFLFKSRSYRIFNDRRRFISGTVGLLWPAMEIKLPLGPCDLGRTPTAPEGSSSEISSQH